MPWRIEYYEDGSYSEIWEPDAQASPVPAASDPELPQPSPPQYVESTAPPASVPVVPGTLNASGNPQFVQGTPEFIQAEQLVRQESREDLRRAAIANGFPPDAAIPTITDPDTGQVYITLADGKDINITSYFEGNPKPPVAIDISVPTYGTSTVTTPFRNVTVTALPEVATTVNTSEGSIVVDPNSEIARFIQWQGSQYDPNNGGTVRETWARQGISDPYSSPDIVSAAAGQVNRADNRTALYNQSGVTPPAAQIAPWNDPNWPAYQGSNKEAYSIASAALNNASVKNQLKAENGWDEATFQSWALRSTNPDEWGIQAAAASAAAGLVVGPSAGSRTGLSANGATVVTTTGAVNAAGFAISTVAKAVSIAESVSATTASLVTAAAAASTNIVGSFAPPDVNPEEDPFEAARLAAIAEEEEENAINLSALDVEPDETLDPGEEFVENPFAEDVEPQGSQILEEDQGFTDLAEPVDPDADPELLSDNPEDEPFTDLAEPVDPDADPELLGGPEEDEPYTDLAEPVDPDADPELLGGPEEEDPYTDLAEPVDPDADPELVQLGGPTDEEELVQLGGPEDVDPETLEGYGVAETGATGAVSGVTPTDALASQQNATLLKAKEQATLQARYKQPASSDWRVRLQLAPQANYLYKAKPPGILAPLYNTDGVIFPYTPSIETSYTASYDRADLVHSNYRGYFYKNSAVGDINIRGIFTAQDTQEADYLLAVIHFFRSVTKMFYGQDTQRGAPPPLVYLSGLGQYQFNQHPCLVSSFTYSLPTDVDYIRAGAPNNYGTNLLSARAKTNGAQASNAGSAVLSRLLSANLNTSNPTLNVPVPNQLTQNVNNLSQATYVPTKIEISLQLLPINTRSQISQQFSLKDFAAGSLIKGGFW